MRNTQRRRQQKKEHSVKLNQTSSTTPDKTPSTTPDKTPSTTPKKILSIHHSTEDGYWEEISSLCIDQESLRLQQQLLDIAKKNLEETAIDNPRKIHAALETVHLLAKRVEMLRT
jgi:hypothetical protein